MTERIIIAGAYKRCDRNCQIFAGKSEYRGGEVRHRPSAFKVPGFALKLVMGEMAQELLLSSQKVLPQRLLEMGYQFRFPELKTALEDILGDE